MEVKLDHRNLDLFHHFGDSAENENNTTRAFLIAATRSPWSPVLFRSFLDLLRERMEETAPQLAPGFDKFFRSWPEKLDVSMELDISAEKFPGQDVSVAILVALTPVSEGNGEGETSGRQELKGRVDATLVIRHAEEEPPGVEPTRPALAIVIESKLYGPAGAEQLGRYKGKLEQKSITTALVEISWEEVYRLCESLPEAAEHDAVIKDFKQYLARDARLVGFTGFHEEDFGKNSLALDTKLEKFCDRLAGTDRILDLGRPERKRDGLDYDLPLPQQSRLVGNIGIASWKKDRLYAKLAIGWRSRWHTDQVLRDGWRAEGVDALIEQLAQNTSLHIEAHVRPFTTVQDSRHFAFWTT